MHSPLTVHPRQVVGLRPARRHEKPGLYPIYAIAGASPEGDPTPTPAPAPAPTPPAPTGDPAPAPTPPTDPTPTPAAEKVEDLPDWAQKIIRDTRAEAAAHRTAKQAEADKIKAILAAAGVGNEDDPVKALEASQQQNTALSDEVYTLRVERDLRQVCADAKADPEAILDRLHRLGKLDDLDDEGSGSYSSLLAPIVAEVLKNDPKLAAAPAAGTSGPEITGGPGLVGQITEEQLKTMTPEQIVEAQDKGLMRNLLGG